MNSLTNHPIKVRNNKAVQEGPFFPANPLRKQPTFEMRSDFTDAKEKAKPKAFQSEKEQRFGCPYDNKDDDVC